MFVLGYGYTVTINNYYHSIHLDFFFLSYMAPFCLISRKIRYHNSKKMYLLVFFFAKGIPPLAYFFFW